MRDCQTASFMKRSTPPTSPHAAWLIAGGAASLGIAILHVAIIFAGARGYAYFGAGELAVLAQRGSLYPATVTALITVVFLACAAFAASGAGLLPTLPLLRTVLVCITLVYFLRGLVLLPDLIRLLLGAPYPPRHALFSATALIVGITHAVGTVPLLRLRRREGTA